MSKGSQQVTIKCPIQDCDHEFKVTVNWWDYPAYTPRGEYAPVDPPDKGCEISDMPNDCPACHTVYDEKDWDAIQSTAEYQLSLDGSDHDEGPDFEEFYERYKEGLND
jgi:hypothetical protein